MILVDTSVWIDYFRGGNAVLKDLLLRKKISCHPFVLGELALGHFAPGQEPLEDLADLPYFDVADHDEVLQFIAVNRLFGRGIGYVDTHLLAAARMSPNGKLWTFDKRLEAVASDLGVKASLTS